MGCHFLLQGIFPEIKRSSQRQPCLLDLLLLPLCYLGSSQDVLESVQFFPNWPLMLCASSFSMTLLPQQSYPTELAGPWALKSLLQRPAWECKFPLRSHSFEFSFCSPPWKGGGGGSKEMTLTRITNFRDHQELSFPRAHLIFNAILPVKKESIWQMKNLRLRKENT